MGQADAVAGEDGGDGLGFGAGVGEGFSGPVGGLDVVADAVALGIEARDDGAQGVWGVRIGLHFDGVETGLFVLGVVERDAVDIRMLGDGGADFEGGASGMGAGWGVFDDGLDAGDGGDGRLWGCRDGLASTRHDGLKFGGSVILGDGGVFVERQGLEEGGKGAFVGDGWGGILEPSVADDALCDVNVGRILVGHAEVFDDLGGLHDFGVGGLELQKIIILHG